MAVSFDLDSIEGIAIGVTQGTLTLEELEQAGEAIWRLAKGPRIRILWDLRESRFELSPAEVRSLAEFVKQAAPSGDLRTAFVVAQDLEFGLVRMFEAFRQQAGTRTWVFRDKEKAVGWLLGDPA